MGEAVAILLCLVPTLWETYDDQKGESKKDKTRDLLISIVLYSVIALVNWKLSVIPVFKSLALSFGWRLLVFDYAISYVLIRRGVIVGKWWNYRGKTARWDRLISKVDWRLLMAARVALFALAVGWFESSSVHFRNNTLRKNPQPVNIMIVY